MRRGTWLLQACCVAMAASAAQGPAHALTYNYIPSKIALQNLDSAGVGKVCVLGSSMQQTAPGSTVAVLPPYYLTGTGWQQVTSTTTSVSALEVGTDITGFSPSPSAAQPYINSATVRIFLVQNPAIACSSISYTYKNTATGDLNAAYYPYPTGLLEFSAYPKNDLPKKGDTSQVLTIDTSNVDTFELPLSMTVTRSAKVIGIIGNPTAAPATRVSMITGASGGTTSPFAVWLARQPGYQSGPNLFAGLALSSKGWGTTSKGTAGSYPYAMLQSPTDFLSFKCIQQGSFKAPWYVPAKCGLNGRLINWADPLGTFYQKELEAFFTNAVLGSGKGAKRLVVMGDAQGKINEAPWIVAGKFANCPVYLKPDGRSLIFKSSYVTPIIVCNPLNQIVQMAAPTPTASTYQQTSDKIGVLTTATIQLTKDQYAAYKDKVGWNFGQPESGWIGNVTGFAASSAGYVMKLNVLGTPVAPVGQRPCVVTALKVKNPQVSCPTANPSFSVWVFTNIKQGTSVNPFETPSQMVFGNDGAFNAWLYYSDSDLMTVAQSIERNIVWAFAHGIANCNNVTMGDTVLQPAYCKSVSRLQSTSYATGAYYASDAYWANEGNWYPVGGPQNYYAQYLHTAQLTSSGTIAPTPCDTCANIFRVPNGWISHVARSNQGFPMGMAYGFGYDENPDYITAAMAQVPSKLDPIPTAWGLGKNIGVTVTISGD